MVRLNAQFVGPVWSVKGPYTFYKSLKYSTESSTSRILVLGDFFFLRISPHEDPCIGELQLLWEDKHESKQLSAIKLYFLPEQTPEGRKDHGEVIIAHHLQSFHPPPPFISIVKS